jgi:uncharacterized protein YdhG (YjbR/CyaY superfamily)
MSEPTTVEDYLAALPEQPRAALKRIRETIKEAAPEATEKLAYKMPAFYENGRFLVSYGAYKHHCSLFPASEGVREALGEELKSHFSGKGTIRFDPGDPLPAELVKRIIEIRLEETAADR